MRLKNITGKRLFSMGLALLLLLSAGLTGCKKEETNSSSSKSEASSEPEIAVDPNWPVSWEDVRLEEKPETIISLSPALTELVAELGAEDRLAGVSDYCDYPDAVASLERCGTSDRPNFDAIENQKPQLVLSSVPLSQDDTVRLQQMDVQVAVFPRVGDMDALEARYTGLATLLDGMEDGPENGAAVFAPLREDYEELRAAAKSIETPLSGIWLRAVPLVMATGDTFEGMLLEEVLGVKNDAAEFTGWEYPADKAVDLYPDLLFYDKSIDPAYFQGTQVYSTTDAFKNNKLFPFDSLPFERQSGRMFSALKELFALAYPDIHVGAVAMDPDFTEESLPDEPLPDEASEPA